MLLPSRFVAFFTSANFQKLLKLGVKVVTEGGYCTHLAAPSILRTEKFLCALPYGPTVVSLDWVEQCLEQDAVVGRTRFTLKLTLRCARISSS